MLNHNYNPESGLTPDDLYPNNLTLLGFGEFMVSALAEELRNRFDERTIHFATTGLGYMIILPETLTSAQTERIRLFAEGYLAALEWVRR